MRTILSAPLENYLAAILTLRNDDDKVHASALAQHLGVTRASVTGALQSLHRHKMIEYRPYRPVVLTPQGLEQAQRCHRKQELLEKFFTVTLGLNSNLANQVACRIEHAVSEEVLERLTEFGSYLEDCQERDFAWTSEGKLVCQTTPSLHCDECPRSARRISDQIT